jgi:SOS response regulatory protein OraA/RecX
MNVFETHQKKIALATLKLHKVGASVMGGMTHQEAVQYLKKMGMSESSLRAQLKGYGHSDEDITEFMKDPS